MKNIYLENAAKNILLVFALLIIHPVIQNSLLSSGISQDKAIVGNLLVAVSILAVTACFGNFAFTYEKVNIKNPLDRLLAHATTGLLMLLIGLSLEMTSILARFLLDGFVIFDLSLAILYAASVLYDFWDLKKAGL